jgi:branched-chain amino acid transport system permease protein
VAGAIVASLIVGVVEALAANYLGGKTREVVPYLVVLVVLVVVVPVGLHSTC